MKHILITGVSTGIGYYCAKALRKRGYTVAGTVRNPEDKLRLESEGVPVVHMDMSVDASIEEGFKEVLNLLNGRIDVLFNNAAYGQPGAVEDLPTAVLRKQFEVNFFGWHTLTCLVLPVMRKQGSGRIVQNSSILGFAAMPFRGAYNASKFALEGITDTLRLELKGTGIDVILIEPGPIESRFRANARKAFLSFIDYRNSVHTVAYEQRLKQLEEEKSSAAFVLGPEAVYKKLLHAIESRTPKIRYYVTFPTHLIAWLKRFLPMRLIDRILLKGE